jgi:hypothetical protein
MNNETPTPGDEAPMLIYQHEDGRIAVVSEAQLADFAAGDPAWHRYGPPDIVRIASRASAGPDAMPSLPQSLLNLIAEYGFARVDGVNDFERIHRWELLIDGIKDYASTARGIGVRSTTTEGRGPEGVEPGPQDAPGWKENSPNLWRLGSTDLARSPAPAPAEPPGWKLVPVEPTRPMLLAAAMADCGPDEDGVHRLDPWIRVLWRDMLAATPPQAAAPAPDPVLGRDVEWILAMGHALGMGSGIAVPVAPNVEAFRELFAALASPPAPTDSLGASASPTALSAPALRASAPIAGAGALREPVGSIHRAHLKPKPGPWCKEILLYSPDNQGDSPETRVMLYAEEAPCTSYRDI